MPNPSNHVYALKHVYVPVWLSRHFMNPDHALCYKAGVLTPTEGIGDELVQVVHLHDLVCRVRATPNGITCCAAMTAWLRTCLADSRLEEWHDLLISSVDELSRSY